MKFNDIYKGKKVFLTGHTGFKGSWMALWLKSLGAEVLGYALEPNTNPSMFEELEIGSKIESVFGNILDVAKLEKTMLEFKPDMVFHLAAQPLVRLSYSEPVMTYQTNVIGSLNVLEAARKCGSVKAFVNVTTDKCYENKEVERGYREDEPMGGHDMYSSSKGCVEIMASSYRRSFLKNDYAMACARAGNVIGGGDWALDRLIPDCVKFINENKRIEIRNPIAVRPWQHVLEPLSGYLRLGQLLFEQGHKYADGFNFGPHEESVLKVCEVAQKVAEFYGKGEVFVNKTDDLHEAGLLMLNVEKAEQILGWTPTYSAEEAIEKTIEWYRRFYNEESERNRNEVSDSERTNFKPERRNGEKMYDFTIEQIKNFEKISFNTKIMIK